MIVTKFLGTKILATILIVIGPWDALYAVQQAVLSRSLSLVDMLAGLMLFVQGITLGWLMKMHNRMSEGSERIATLSERTRHLATKAELNAAMIALREEVKSWVCDD